ncbi:MAG: ATP-binding protein [Defluviitaleaceae bacterium]|nr:ATP-binding protein [Defluviitaleaceae bacterium]MCL2238985.1 ATP-binding protein [Defluviitaleaceae bacterium]
MVKKYRSVTFTLGFIFLGIIIFAITGVVWIRATQTNAQMQNLIAERLKGNINTTLGTFETVQEHTLGILDIVANLPRVHIALTPYEHYQPYPLSDSLDAFMGSPLYENISVFDTDLRLMGQTNPHSEIFLSEMFIENAVRAGMGMSHISYARINPFTGYVQKLYTQPVIRDGYVYGLVAILLNTQRLDIYLRDFIHDADSFVNVADASGTLFFSNRASYIGMHVDDLGVYEAFGRIPINEVFVHTSAITGVDKIAYIEIEPHLNWTIVSFFDAHSVESTTWLVFVSLLPTVSGVTLAGFLVLIIIVRTLKPLRTLALTAKEVAEGNLDIQFTVQRNDEIGLAFDSFEEVVTSLKRLIIEAESASKAKGDFLAKMSHEIRTPMNAIIGMTELILMEELSPNARDQATIIKNSGNHLLSIINDILDFSKIESGKMEVVESEYLFHSTINDVVNIINTKMINPKVNFVAYMERNVPNRLIGDEVRLRQVLINLLNNSVKYTREGRITLDVSWKKTEEDSLVLTVRIKDTGIGIKPEDLKNLFGEFQQFDMEKNKNVEGTGLGLAITHNLVRLMGGHVAAESTYGLGSIFTLTLPQRFVLEEFESHWEEAELDDSGNNILLTGRTRLEETLKEKSIEQFRIPSARILVVDDVPTNLRVAQGLLAPYEAMVDICLSGREALKAVTQKHYDIVFMDHMMPDMDGLEATRTIREMQEGRFAKLNIIALSANAIVGAKEMFLLNGLNDFLSKPIELDKLNAILAKWIPAEKQIRAEVVPPPKEAPAEELTIAGIDTKRGLTLSGGNKAVYHDILTLFHQDIEAKVSQLTNAANSNNFNLYNIYVHALKSACANIGALTLSEQAAKLEAAAIQQDLSFIHMHNPALLKGLVALQESIGQTLNLEKDEATDDSAQEDYDRDALHSALSQLKVALESYDALAIDEANKTITEFAKHPSLKELLKALLDNVFVGMYPDAIGQINKIIETE